MYSADTSPYPRDSTPRFHHIPHSSYGYPQSHNQKSIENRPPVNSYTNQIYPNSHSQRCLRLSLSPGGSRTLPKAQIDRTIEGLQAWESKRLLKQEQLRLELETVEMEAVTFRPELAPHTVKIMREQDLRQARNAGKVVNLTVRKAVEKAMKGLSPKAKTHFNASAFRTTSLPVSRSGSPIPVAGPMKVAKRNEVWLQSKIARIKARAQEYPEGATFSPQVNSPVSKPAPDHSIQDLLLLSSSYNRSQTGSTRATFKAEPQEQGRDPNRKKETWSSKLLSPVNKKVSYQAGLDLDLFMKRAKPLVQMKDLGL